MDVGQVTKEDCTFLLKTDDWEILDDTGKFLHLSQGISILAEVY